MAGTVFSDWLTALTKLQTCVSKDLDEIRQQKAEIQQLKQDVFNRLAEGRFVRDDRRLVLSAPEIVIGNVDASGMLYSEGGSITIRGQKVGIDGVGENGAIESRASTIRQTAVDPGIDGIEEVVRSQSAIISQAKHITIQSNEAEKDGYFSRSPRLTGSTGVLIHADERLEIDASESSELRAQEIGDRLKDLTSTIATYTADCTTAMIGVTAQVAEMETLLALQEPMELDEMTMRTTVTELDALTEQFNEMMPAVYSALESAVAKMSQLAEANRQMKCLQDEQISVATASTSFKEKSTDATLQMTAEHMDIASVDGDGNIRTNPEASICVQTGRLDISTKQEDGSLIDDSYVQISTHDVRISTVNPKLNDAKENEDGDYTTEGSVTINSKQVAFTAVDYSVSDGKYEEKDQTKDSSFSIRAENMSMMSMDKDQNTTGCFLISAENAGLVSMDKDGNCTGSLKVAAKDVSLSSVDKDGNTTGSLAVKADDIAMGATDKSGKASGQFSLNSKDVFVKSMDTDDNGADKSLAAGGNMVIVAEKMFVGRTDKDNLSKELQISSDKTGVYGKTTAEVQQGEAKAVLQLDGGNVAVGGSKAEFYGDNTVNGKTTFKGDITAPKAAIDSLQAKSEFKSPNIKDGMPAAPAAGGGSLSAKLKEADAPKAKVAEKKEDSSGK